MSSNVKRMLLFWPLTVVAGLAYIDVWSRWLKALTPTPVNGSDGWASFVFFIQSYVILTILVVVVAGMLSKYFRRHWKKAPQSDLILFVLCWAVSVIVFLNPNTIVGLHSLLLLIYP